MNLILRDFVTQLPKFPFRCLDSKGKLGTMFVTSRPGIISVIYKKMIKTILQTTGTYTTIFQNQLQKALDKVIGENQSAAV